MDRTRLPGTVEVFAYEGAGPRLYAGQVLGLEAPQRTPVAQQAGLSRIDHLIPGKDGGRLLAIQGEPQSETRRMVTVDIAAASRREQQVSSRLAATAGQAVVREQATARQAEADVALRRS